MASTRRTFLSMGVAGVAGLRIGPRAALGQGGSAPDVLAMVGRAVAFLRSRQAKDGSWSGDRQEPGITALVVTALLRTKRVPPADPAVEKGLAYLEKYVGAKGGLSEAPHSIYTTSVALMAFHEANVGGKYDRVIKGCQDFLKESQFDEGEKKGPKDPQYGGLGYGGDRSRPDLSNTSFMMEALHDSGLPPDDPALQKALLFVSRCQNLKSEFNDQPYADKVNDGGFLYTAGGPASPAGRGGRGGEAGKAKAQDGPARSTAGMTYAGLKSMVYAGLRPDDVRVKAALGYIAKNYTLDENPGGGQRGLYYYYLMFGRAMGALGKKSFTDAEGKEHDWKAELAAALARRQDPSGAWANKDDRFMEGDPNIVTSYALMALAAGQ
ncbi:Prenyltransferase and squalene oxidase repeat protein [Aquisphaera giovannonii]|uniref:Prenyltransferase and squalene oxidase repeat protein n=1 Tax=Aquisphaera giovannonii TaxID=406548 RepID=A0A5B9W2F1_9BACT|nr:prenyltransferase/squalene oxidase repeat-containing protein [Aquisphaera giovannonii]QEH34763.1 Prenyltransferase and squalene oxidase repeat protein [Aquisphaera giovannonii]